MTKIFIKDKCFLKRLYILPETHNIVENSWSITQEMCIGEDIFAFIDIKRDSYSGNYYANITIHSAYDHNRNRYGSSCIFAEIDYRKGMSMSSSRFTKEQLLTNTHTAMFNALQDAKDFVLVLLDRVNKT